ncbi:MAG: hypothetical protein ABL967_12845 [Bryobacteraceae bacterium]
MSVAVTIHSFQKVAVMGAFTLIIFAGAERALAQARVGLGPDVAAVTYDPLNGGPYREVSVLPESQAQVQAGTVSADVLRHPVSGKTRKRLRKTLETIEAGDHPSAILQLRALLVEQPDAAVFAHNLLGIEYLRTGQFRNAADSLERAARLLPRDGMTRHNWGLSLICAGEFARGQQEVQRALELEPKNPTVQALHSFLLKHTASRAD